MIFLTEEKNLDLNNKIVCLYFYANWMPFNKKMLNMLSKMEEKYKDASYYAIDLDFFKNICKNFEIDSIPTIILYKNNKEFKRINGVVLTSVIKHIFADIFKMKE